MRVSARHWTVALLAALLVHAGLIAMLLSVPPDEGAMAAGVGGIEIGFGPAGGAPGTVAREAANLPEAEADSAAEAADETPPEDAAAPLEVEPLEAETVEAIEAPTESPPPEAPDLAETRPEEVEAVVAETTPAAQEPPAREAGEPAPKVTVAEPLPAELAEAARIEEALAAAEPPAQIPTERAVVAAAVEPPQETPPPDPPQEVTAAAPVTVPAPRTRPERPRPKTVQRETEPKPPTAEPPKPAEAEPTPPTAEVVAAEAGSSDPSDTQTANVAPSMAGDGGKAGTKGLPDVGSGDGGSRGGIAAAESAYIAQLQAWIDKHKRYPRRAKLRNQQGKPLVFFEIDSRGALLASGMERSSGHGLLDREAVRTLERADPMPTPPEALRGTRLRFIVPLDFSITSKR